MVGRYRRQASTLQAAPAITPTARPQPRQALGHLVSKSLPALLTRRAALAWQERKGVGWGDNTVTQAPLLLSHSQTAPRAATCVGTGWALPG